MIDRTKTTEKEQERKALAKMQVEDLIERITQNG